MAGFGAFGKLPALGDFLRLDTPPGFVAVWDHWVQAALLSGRQSLGTGWQASYMSAPIWRFSLAAGLAGPAPVLGTFMPSVDRVGREYPLTLMAAQGGQAEVCPTHDAAGDTFAALEDISLNALEDTMSRGRLVQALATVPMPGQADRGGQTAALNGSIWSAQTETGQHRLTCRGLPDAADIATLFDPEAMHRTDAGQTERAAP